MAGGLMVGTVLFASEETILLTDRTLFVAPTWMHLPLLPVSATVVVEYDVVEGCLECANNCYAGSYWRLIGSRVRRADPVSNEHS